jgi:hypothetical protein
MRTAAPANLPGVRNLLVAKPTTARYLGIEDLHWPMTPPLDLVNSCWIRSADPAHLGIARPSMAGKWAIVAWCEKHLADSCSSRCRPDPPAKPPAADRLLTVAELPVALREQIVQRASGVPFYLEETLRMLIDAGFLRRQNGLWQLVEGADVTSLGVPDSLQSLILARFDRLEPPQRRMLQVPVSSAASSACRSCA